MAMKIVPLDVGELKKVGVTLLRDGGHWALRCDRCEQTFPISTHVIPHDYWRCPWGCNCAKPPEPKPEPERSALDKERDRLLRDLAFAREMMETTDNAETKRRFQVEADRLLNELLGSGAQEETEAQQRFEADADRLLTGLDREPERDRDWLEPEPDHAAIELKEYGAYLRMAAEAETEEDRINFTARAEEHLALYLRHIHKEVEE